jgi:hypothetical protein
MMGDELEPGEGPLAGRDLISQRTRRAFREHLVAASTLREIEALFEDEGIACSQEIPAVSGERRTLIEQYYATVNWTSARDVGRVLQVYETILTASTSAPPCARS